MTSYFSVSFVCLIFPASVFAYAVVPRRFRWLVLLAASYWFVWILSQGLIVCVWTTTLTTYVCGRLLGVLYDRRNRALTHTSESRRALIDRYKGRARWIVAAGITFNVGMLAALKYCGPLSVLLDGLGFKERLPVIGAPVGISYYTLMAVAYLVDVYREALPTERNLGHVALYLCFFPCVMEGPIARYAEVAPTLWAGSPLKGRNAYAGSLRMVVGFAKKLVIADRLGVMVGKVFDNYASYDGSIIALAAVAYTVQLYCDFSGTMDVALGMARTFGIKLPENFRGPFFSKTASEFWRRWHITLGAWFRDYVYYPVLFSKPCKALALRARRRLGKRLGTTLVSICALFFVWLGNGIWHGAGTQFIAFGMYYFVIISLGNLVEHLAQELASRLRVNRDAFPYQALRIVRTLVIVCVGELVFRAKGFDVAVEMLRRMAEQPGVSSLVDGTVLSLGLDAQDLWAVGVGTACVLLLDAIGERLESPWDVMASKGPIVRCVVLVFALAVVAVFGAYGYGYVAVNPMYASF